MHRTHGCAHSQYGVFRLHVGCTHLHMVSQWRFEARRQREADALIYDGQADDGDVAVLASCVRLFQVFDVQDRRVAQALVNVP
eukprot:4343825-Prymnesium_polylepis.1